MPAVVLVDTSIFLNVLNVPGMNQAREQVLEALEAYLGQEATNLLLPIAAIFETGNHISKLANGGQRRRFARKFVDQVRKALNGDAPWRPTQMPEVGELLTWLDEFSDHAMRGLGMADFSIVKAWEIACANHPIHRVTIWSLDHQLSGYDRAV